MAAKNPFRVSDLIAKYGWQIMPYLSNLGVRSLAEAQVLFVDSGHANALDADDTEHGHSFEKPLATWDYAVGLLTADEGGVILMAPGHNENIADGETIDNDVDGITCIGLGTGTLRPRFDFDAAASTIDVGGDNVTFVNLTFRPGAADVLIGVDVETGVTNFHMVDCEYLEGEANTDEFLAAVELKAACHDAVIEKNVFRAGWSSNPDDAISLKGASNNVTIRGNRCSGPYGDGAGVTAAISNSAGVCLDLLIENNILKVKDGESGIEVIATTPAVIRHNLIVSTGLAVDSMIVGTIAELDQNIGVTTDGTSGEFIKGGSLAPEVVNYNLDHLAKTADGGTNYPTQVTTDSILGMLMATGGNPSTFVKSTDSLQAISDKVTAIGVPTDVTGAVAATPTASSVQDILQKDGNQTYSRATDSLEAIADAILTGTNILAGINLDHLMKTVVADKQNMTEIADGSALANILVKDGAGTITNFNPTTDSLEAIADAVAGYTTAVSATPTVRSLQDILEKDALSGFDDSTDSLQAISDKAGAFDMTGSGQAGSVKASLDLAHTDIDAILADTLSISGGALPADPTTNSLAAFIASGGTALGQELPDSMSLVDLIGDYTGAHDGAAADDNIKAHLDLIKTDVNTNITSIGTIANTAGTATIGGVFGDFANSSLVTRLTNLQTGATSIGTIVNTAGTATLGALLGDFANVTLVSKLTTLQTGPTSVGTIVNTAGVANLGAALGDFANSTLVARLDLIDTEVDKIGTISNAGGTATIGGALGVLANSSLVARLDIITADTAAIDPGATRVATATTTNWALSATNAMFTVSGMVRARIWGEVLVILTNQATNLKVSSTPTAPGVLVDIAANLDCNADPVGTIYKMNTTLGGAMVEVTNGVSYDDGIEVILPAGVVQLGSGANEAGGGSIQWFCQYEPLEAGAAVTAT